MSRRRPEPELEGKSRDASADSAEQTAGPSWPARPSRDDAVCPVCRHEYPRRQLTKHHLIPKSRRGRETVLLCRPCHSQVHAVLSEKELEREFGTLDALLEAPELQSWIGWIRRRRPSKRFSTRQSRRRQR